MNMLRKCKELAKAPIDWFRYRYMPSLEAGYLWAMILYVLFWFVVCAATFVATFVIGENLYLRYMGR